MHIAHMHFAEISFSINLETLKFKISHFAPTMVAPRGITKQANSLPI